jgi:hypothetical protein
VLLLSLLVHQQLWGNGPVCVSVSSNDADLFGGPVSVPGVAPGAHATLGGVDICAGSPTAALRLVGLLAAWLRGLGWLLVAGGIAAGVVETAARLAILTRVVRSPGPGWIDPGQVTFSVTALLIGLALITAARIMRQGVTMREELDVTI